MTDSNPHQNQLDSSETELDRALDAALAKYARVEPRAGLEDRILSNLRAEPARAHDRSWWLLGFAIAAAAVVLVAIGLVSRSAKHSQPLVQRPTITAPQNVQAQSSPAKTASALLPANGSIARAQPHPQPSKLDLAPPKDTEPDGAETVADNPKLDKFPSPRPLSEQEKLLLEYLQQNPEEAAMIAQAQTAFAHQEELERNSLPPRDANPSLREQPE
jgi:hypothetical protein